jgi:hypothetical protein
LINIAGQRIPDLETEGWIFLAILAVVLIAILWPRRRK